MASYNHTLELSSFPEELLERILDLCVVAPLSSPPPRPSWHQRPNTPPSTVQKRDRTAPLLVSRSFLRIATPLFYHTLHVRSRAQASSLLATLRANPALAAHVRRVVTTGVWSDIGSVFTMCAGIKVLDLTLDLASTEDSDCDAEDFCRGLDGLNQMKHLVLRKPNNVYLTQAKPRYVIAGVASAIENWEKLETAHLAFRLSDDSTSPIQTTFSPIPAPLTTPPSPISLQRPGPITSLTHALRSRPHLHTFATHLPSLWNNTIMVVSQNPRLERIVLGDGKDSAAVPVYLAYESSYPYASSAVQHQVHAIIGTGLFLMEARKHQRLGELIKAGTPIIRTRAHTMGTVPANLLNTFSSPSACRKTSACPPQQPAVSPAPFQGQQRQQEL